MTPDLINSVFAGGVGFFTSLNVYRAIKDGAIKGVSGWAVAFFMCGSLWNLYYYAVLHQPISWLLSVWGAVASVIYLMLFILFSTYTTPHLKK